MFRKTITKKKQRKNKHNSQAPFKVKTMTEKNIINSSLSTHSHNPYCFSIPIRGRTFKQWLQITGGIKISLCVGRNVKFWKREMNKSKLKKKRKVLNKAEKGSHVVLEIVKQKKRGEGEML